jgi:hypothetical protein
MRAVGFLAVLLVCSCGGSVDARPAPSCDPGSIDVEIHLAPPDQEFPGCVEMPARHEYGDTTSRQWCCWKGTVDL